MDMINDLPDSDLDAQLKLEAAVWPDGKVICPKCETWDCVSSLHHGLYHCSACNIRFTVRSNTILQRSPIPDWKWIVAVSGVVDGGNSVALAKRIGVNQMTAWDMIRRIREAVEVSPHIKDAIDGLLLRALLQRAAWRAPGECNWDTMSAVDKMVIRDGKRGRR